MYKYKFAYIYIYNHGLQNYADVKLLNHGKKAKIDALISTKNDKIEFCFFLKQGSVFSYLFTKNHWLEPETSYRKPAESAEK